MSREKDFAKNTFVLGLGTVLPRLVQFVVLPILTGFLTKEEYGTYDFILVLVNLLLPAATLQIHQAGFRFLIDVKEDKAGCARVITCLYALIVPVSLLVLTVFFFCYRNLAYSSRLYMCLYLFADILVLSGLYMVRGLAKNRQYSRASILLAIGKLIFLLIAVRWLRKGLNGALLSLVLANAVTFLYLFFGCRIYQFIDFKAVSLAKIKEMLRYSLPLVPGSLAGWIIRASDRLVVTNVLGVVSTAVYAVASKLPRVFDVLLGAITLAWQENASVHVGDDDVHTYYASMFARIYDLMAGGFGLVVAATPVLFKIFIRGDYAESYIHIPILFMAAFFKCMAEHLGGIYIAYKKTKSVAATTAVAAAVNLTVDLLFIRRIGIFAASVSTLVSYMFLFIYRMWDVRHFVRMEYHYKRLILVFLILVGECVLCALHTVTSGLVLVAVALVAFVITNKNNLRIFYSMGRGLIKKLFRRRLK